MNENTSIWRTKDGREIRVCDMTDDHLKNAIRFLQNTARIMVIRTSVECACMLPPRGEMAQLAFDQEVEQGASARWEDVVHEIFWEMKAEARIRGFDLDELIPDTLEEDVTASILLLEKVTKGEKQ